MSKKLHQKVLVIALLLTITSTFSQVGIGTTTPDPDAALEINSTDGGVLLPRIALTATTSPSPLSADVAGMLVYNTDTAGDVTPGFYYNDGTDWVRLGGAAAGNNWTLTGNTGTTASTAAIGSAVNNNFIGTTDAKDWVLATNNLERMRILSGGNIGIGTDTPAELLHLKSIDSDIDMETIGVDASSLNFHKSRGTIAAPTTVQDGTLIGKVDFLGFDGTGYIEAAGIDAFVDGTPGTNDMPTAIAIATTPDGSATSLDRITIRADGRVGIGTTSPLALLDVVTNDSSGYAAYFYNDGNNNNRYGIAVQCGRDNGNFSGILDAYDGNGTLEGGLEINGGSVALWQNSDRRLKYDINKTEFSGLNIIHKLRLVDYKWKKNDARVKFGFIAQEVQEVYPEMIHKREDSETLGIYPNMLVPVLVKAVQEQQELLDKHDKELDIIKKLMKEQQKMVTTLQAKIESLR